MSTETSRHELGSGRITYAAIPLAILSIVEIAAYAPVRDLASARIWILAATGVITLTVVVLLCGEIIRRSTELLTRHSPAAAEINLAIGILLVATVHTWVFLRSSSAELLPWAPDWIRLTAFACTLAAGYAVVRKLLLRLGLDRPRILVLMVAILATVIGMGGALRSAVEANSLADLRLPVLVSGGAIVISTCMIGLSSRRWYPLLVGLPVITGLIAMRALVGIHDGWGQLASVTETPVDSPPIIFIVLDTFRADALDLRDPEESNTPHLARLAETSDVYPDAIANASWTLPGHASLFTGLTLSKHRTDRTLEPGFSTFLPRDIPTSHELFARHGYRTTCIVANGIVGMASQLARGCQSYRNPSRHWLGRLTFLGLVDLVSKSRFAVQQLILEFSRVDFNANADEIVDLALQQLQTELRSTYLLMNFLDVHGPIYRLEGPTRPSLRSRLLMRRDLVLRLLGLVSETEVWSRHHDTLRSYYDAETRKLDKELGRFFRALERIGWFDDALIVVTSDHGEAFFENSALHSYFSHHSAYEPAVRIPLIVKRPGQQQGSRPARRAQQVDVFPTLLEIVDLPQLKGLNGRSVTAPAREPAITEWYRRSPEESFPFLSHNRIALYHGRFKYVMEGDGGEYLYDLERSPYEQVDVLEEHRGLAARLRSQAEELTKKPEPDPSKSKKSVDPKLLEQLRALGYAQ